MRATETTEAEPKAPVELKAPAELKAPMASNIFGRIFMIAPVQVLSENLPLLESTSLLIPHPFPSRGVCRRRMHMHATELLLHRYHGTVK